MNAKSSHVDEILVCQNTKAPSGISSVLNPNKELLDSDIHPIVLKKAVFVLRKLICNSECSKFYIINYRQLPIFVRNLYEKNIYYDFLFPIKHC